MVKILINYFYTAMIQLNNLKQYKAAILTTVYSTLKFK